MVGRSLYACDRVLYEASHFSVRWRVEVDNAAASEVVGEDVAALTGSLLYL